MTFYIAGATRWRGAPGACSFAVTGAIDKDDRAMSRTYEEFLKSARRSTWGAASKCYLAPFMLPDGRKSFSEIWAKDKDEADTIANARGMGPCKPATGTRKEFRPSVLAVLPGGWMRGDVFHSICYLGFLAARHGVVSAEDLVSDGSALHELAHMHHAGPNACGGNMEKLLESAVERLERSIPGMPPPEMKLKMP